MIPATTGLRALGPELLVAASTEREQQLQSTLLDLQQTALNTLKTLDAQISELTELHRELKERASLLEGQLLELRAAQKAEIAALEKLQKHAIAQLAPLEQFINEKSPTWRPWTPEEFRTFQEGAARYTPSRPRFFISEINGEAREYRLLQDKISRYLHKIADELKTLTRSLCWPDDERYQRCIQEAISAKDEFGHRVFYSHYSPAAAPATSVRGGVVHFGGYTRPDWDAGETGHGSATFQHKGEKYLIIHSRLLQELEYSCQIVSLVPGAKILDLVLQRPVPPPPPYAKPLPAGKWKDPATASKPWTSCDDGRLQQIKQCRSLGGT